MVDCLPAVRPLVPFATQKTSASPLTCFWKKKRYKKAAEDLSKETSSRGLTLSMDGRSE